MKVFGGGLPACLHFQFPSIKKYARKGTRQHSRKHQHVLHFCLHLYANASIIAWFVRPRAVTHFIKCYISPPTDAVLWIKHKARETQRRATESVFCKTSTLIYNQQEPVTFQGTYNVTRTRSVRETRKRTLILACDVPLVRNDRHILLLKLK